MEALSTDSFGNRSTAVGKGTLKNQIFASTTDAYNVAIGYEAGNDITVGIRNVLIGGLAGDAFTDADYNVAVGYQTLSADTKGVGSIAVGYKALALQDFTSVGVTQNTAIGYLSGDAVTTGTRNTFCGYQSGSTISTTFGNTFYGNDSGVNATGQLGTFIGDNAGQNSTGNSNTYIGQQAGYLITSGANNTVIGRFDGNQGGLDIRTSSDHIVLSDGNGTPRQITTNSGTSSWTRDLSDSDRANNSNYHAIHNNLNAQPTVVVEHSGDSTPNGIFIDFSDADPDNTSQWFIKAEGSSGAERFKVLSNGNTLNANDVFGAISDEKLKEQIKDASSQWNDIKALKIRKYKFKTDVAKGDSDEHWRLGVIAQELETSGMNGLVMDIPDMIENKDGENVESGTTTKSVKTSVLHMKAVKALQEAIERIETLEAEVKALKGE